MESKLRLVRPRSEMSEKKPRVLENHGPWIFIYQGPYFLCVSLDLMNYSDLSCAEWNLPVERGLETNRRQFREIV